MLLKWNLTITFLISNCGNLDSLICHLSDVRAIPNRNSKVCVVCGKDCYHICMKCRGPDGKSGVAMHCGKSHGDDSRVPCFYYYHNTQFFGLAKNDFQLAGIKRKRDWTPSNKLRHCDHSKQIKRILTQQTVVVNTPQDSGPVNRGVGADSSVNWDNVV